MSDVKMLKKETFKTYRLMAEQFEAVYNHIKSLYGKTDAEDLCKLRGYIGQEQLDLIKELQIGVCFIESSEINQLGTLRDEMGLTTIDKNTGEEKFLLNGRYIVPIRDIAGNLVALVGYFNDHNKYITTSSTIFSKNALFFNIDHAYRLSWEKYNGVVFLVEGIFDALSLRAIGIPAIATMGVTVENPKCELLKFFSKVIAIPDNDRAGKKALARGTKESWIVPPNTTFLRIKGICKTPFGDLKVKDVDNLVSYFDDVKEMLLQYKYSKELLEELILV